MTYRDNDRPPAPYESSDAASEDATLLIPTTQAASDARRAAMGPAQAAPHGIHQPPQRPNAYLPQSRGAPANPTGPYAPNPGMAPAMSPPAASNQVIVPTAPKLPARTNDAPFPGWFLPYVIGCLFLVLVGAFVLWIQARAIGHF